MRTPKSPPPPTYPSLSDRKPRTRERALTEYGQHYFICQAFSLSLQQCECFFLIIIILLLFFNFSHTHVGPLSAKEVGPLIAKEVGDFVYKS